MEALETVTPTTTTETPPPAAPATSEPSSSAPVSERPTNVRELSKFMEQSAAPESQTAAVTTAPAATVQGQPGTDPGSTATALKGSMPLADHQKVLANARAKERATVTAEIDKEIGWARNVPRESVTRMAELADRLNTDPVGFLNQLQQELSAHPTYAQQIRPAGKPAGVQGIEPDVEVHDAQGRVVARTFSDAMLAKRDAALAQQIKAELLGEVRPLREDLDRRAGVARAEEQSKQINAEADTIMGRIDTILDGRKDLYPTVNQLIGDGMDAIDAALMVMRQSIVPTRTASAQQSAVATMKKKAAGNTANGAGTSVAATARPKNARELAKYLENLGS